MSNKKVPASSEEKLLGSVFTQKYEIVNLGPGNAVISRSSCVFFS
jgi:hypothetical protein